MNKKSKNFITQIKISEHVHETKRNRPVVISVSMIFAVFLIFQNCGRQLNQPLNYSNPEATQVSKAANWAYVSHAGDQTISQYEIDPQSGQLGSKPLSKTPTGGKDTQAIAIEPSGKWLYVADEASSSIFQFAIDEQTGELSPLSEAKVVTLRSPSDLKIDSSGKWVYVMSDRSHAIGRHAIDQNTGQLSESFEANDLGKVLFSGYVLDPTGSWAYSVDRSTGTILQFSIDHKRGEMIPVPEGSIKMGYSPMGIAIH